ncbi:MAG: chloride channel protein [Bacteroidota bacterium]|nr:chloride channel protein [Bacteroidota bacterium]
MHFEKYIKPLIIWRLKHIPDQHFILILSAVIGLTSGLAAVVIKNSVHFIQELIKNEIFNFGNYLYIAYPVIGIFFAVLFIKFIIRRKVNHGIPAVLYSISKENGIMKQHNMFSSIITSAFTVGFGGSVGLEGPTVATGASIGSNIGRLFRMSYKTKILLIGCASAGAMSAIFKAPITGIIFAIEVIMLDLTMSSLVPLLIASSIAALTSYFFLGRDVLFHFTLQDEFLFNDIPFFVILGIFTGLISTHFTRMYMKIRSYFERINKWQVKILVGGIALGILIFILPPLYGEGYETINSLLKGDYKSVMENSMFSEFQDNMYVVFGFLILLIFLKVVATSITFGAGGIGGIFAPTLFMGSTLGFTFAKILQYFGIKDLSVSNFALVGMAGTIAGVLFAPLTAIFLIAEITGGYQLFVPLMITAAVSYTTIRLFESNSVYTIQLAKRGELLTHHKDKTILKLIKVNDVVETNFITVRPNDTLGYLVNVIKKSVRNIFPVIDEKGNYLGLIPLDNIRNIMFDQGKYDKIFVKDLMIDPHISVTTEDGLDIVMAKFRSSGHWNLPVVDKGKYLGFVSRANIFNSYRKMLVEFSED